MEAPKIVEADEIMVVGMRVKNSYSNDKTIQLWQQFMPRRNEIAQKTGTKCYSIQSFSEDLMKTGFSPDMVFDKWCSFSSPLFWTFDATFPFHYCP